MERQEPSLFSRSSALETPGTPLLVSDRRYDEAARSGPALPKPRTWERLWQFAALAILLGIALGGYQVWDSQPQHFDLPETDHLTPNERSKLVQALDAGPRPSYIPDLATNMCMAHQGIIGQAIYMRRSGMPIGLAEDMAKTARDVDQRLYTVLLRTIRLAYVEPDIMDAMLRKGYWTLSCSKVIRGY